ncbi:MAG: DUF2007 domain-containing protein [Pseudomonadales bacterium]|nr:DUF2007 domain-containing protein [Pseudomonadales bacterium]
MLTTVAAYSFPYEAHIGRAKLESEGIPAFVADEHTINMQWLYSNALGGVRLQVAASHRDAALKILNEDRSDLLADEEGEDLPTCEKCGSTNTEFYQIGKRFAFLVFLGLHFPLFPTRTAIRCLQCQHITKT